MKISILSPDVSHNCLFREYTLARLLSKKHKVEIIGPNYGDGLWPPLKDMRDISVKSVYGDSKTGKFNWKLLLRLIDGDIIYAHKPYGSSFGLGIYAKFAKKKPLILDLDDYEPAFYGHLWEQIPLWKKVSGFIPALSDPRSHQWMVLLNKLLWLTDAITVTNSKLQEAYGGTIIPQAVDTNVLHPVPNVNNEPVIAYIGTSRPHKGLYELVKVLVLLRHRPYTCIITASGDREYLYWVQDLIKKAKIESKIKIIPIQPYSNMNNLLSTVDIVVIPQQNALASQYQVPAKLLDAMATGKLIIVSDLSVIREVVGDCAMLTKPSDLFDLTIALDSALVSPGNIGELARKRCVKEYDMKVVRKKLNKVMRDVL